MMKVYLEYEKFREILLEVLREIFGYAAVVVRKICKDNDVEREAFCIRPKDEKDVEIPLAYPEDCYRDYMECGISLKQCVKRIVDMQKQMEQKSILSQTKYKLMDWDSIKTEIYPILLSTELNRKSPKGVIKRELMDLSIVYVVRLVMGEGCCCQIKITEPMLKSYGISVMELHNQAVLNVKKDGYKFQRMEDMILGVLNEQEETKERIDPASECWPVDEAEETKMYVLTNSLRMFGAAGILDREFLKDKLGEKNYYMLPSSVHEMIFVPAVEGADWKALNCMVREVNASEVLEEERLSDHCYFYEGKTGKLRTCA